MKDFIEKIHCFLTSQSWGSAIFWMLAVCLMVAILVWFFLFSGFGVPAEPVYEGF